MLPNSLPVQWELVNQGQKYVLQFPCSLSSGDWLPLSITTGTETQKVYLQWNPTLEIFKLKENLAGNMAKTLRLRNHQALFNEAINKWMLHLDFGTNKMWSDLECSLYDPVSQNRKSSERQVMKFVAAPIHGKVIKILVQEGQDVEPGTELLIIEAMKMENRIIAQQKAKIKGINVQTGDSVVTGQKLIVF